MMHGLAYLLLFPGLPRAYSAVSKGAILGGSWVVISVAISPLRPSKRYNYRYRTFNSLQVRLGLNNLGSRVVLLRVYG